MKTQILEKTRTPGFALVVTLSLMILLTVVAIGLLTLSSISLRSTSQGDAMQAARANAKVALLLAIGDLQKQLGPDTRISATADQISNSAGDESTTPKTQRQWSGGYNSWAAPWGPIIPDETRPAPQFLQWFVSGDPARVTLRNFASTAIGTDPKTSVEIVTNRTVGNIADTVRVPLMTQTSPNSTKNTFGWWVSDLGMKGLIAPAKEIPTTVAEVRADQQVAPASNFKAASIGMIKPFEQVSLTDPNLVNIATWQSGGLIADSPSNIQGLFHDLTPVSRGLLTNVRAGGFRKDLSMALQRTTAPSSTANDSVLYRVNGEPGINLQELWAFYHLHTKVSRSGSATFTTGGRMPSGTTHLRVANGPSGCASDDSFYFKQPVIISYQVALSLLARVVNNASGQPVNRLYLVADPVITLWNPLDVPVVVPTSSFLSVKYWQIPYDISITVNGAPTRNYSLAAIWRNQTDIDQGRNGDGNFMSLRIGQLQQLTFKPGEVIKVSQTGNAIVKGTSPVDHALVGRSGFNFGGGVAVPLRELNGAYLDLATSDVVTYQAKPNRLTAGATTRSGSSVMNTAFNHTRHFSLTHNEYYIGADRGNSSVSLGVGNMAIDWDFGNRRLRVSDNPSSRGATGPGIAGTKPAGDRIYANSTSLKDPFKTFTDGRDLPVSALLSTKQPIMLQSFNAKTENGSNRGTRFLSRFNPKALHVDFYDLSPQELDMLPYEYSFESLSSWKNRSLEVSTNGNSFYGGGMTASDGTSFVTTHSVPKEPIVSLASFQHSFANGFDHQRPRTGYATLNSREPMLPQISHAIGNSMAVPMLPSTSSQGTLNGGRPMADHSYLANQALWDQYFLSGIAPQNWNTFSKSRTQKVVATEFFAGDSKLPVTRFLAELRGKDPTALANKYIPGTTPSNIATDEIASLIRVDGMFNVNSTSVEAWKTLLGARNGRPVVVRDSVGKESVFNGGTETPVAGLLSPENRVASSSGNMSSQDPSQWVGRRNLNDVEIDRLARAIVTEVRKRGPFLCLSDFINRRLGSDDDLARAGAIQSALDSDEAAINAAYVNVNSTTSNRFAFPEAEQGPMAYGNPGVVKQADILTPIAPILSARSDSFLVRGYGEKVDASGNVIARAWCEAIVQRSPEFIDSADVAEKLYSSINSVNTTFGRRFDIVSFRWLSSLEA